MAWYQKTDGCDKEPRLEKPIGVIGTGNHAKLIELADLLTPAGVTWKFLKDFPHVGEVEETGCTFSENARLKAVTYAVRLGEWVLAEDAGLVVDALGGQPGIHSARFAGEPRDDARNIQKLLELMKDIPPERRSARFVCYMALADPRGEIQAEAEGHCCGRITFEPRGTQGFGYDPVFEIPEYHRTLAELGLAVKGCLSHRARAARAILPQIIRLVDSGKWR
ncbi:MAG TPA: RdgB/HAM1 family non-canonical purine NTP pyrophosphatase [Thermogutta sp.]|nr:RdgB/HAM1 family non-canonical purine NTP pyrophosphatase [Thermogutta sp.]